MQGWYSATARHGGARPRGRLAARAGIAQNFANAIFAVLTAQVLDQITKPIEKIAIDQFDELRLVLRVDFKSREPFNIGLLAIVDR